MKPKTDRTRAEKSYRQLIQATNCYQKAGLLVDDARIRLMDVAKRKGAGPIHLFFERAGSELDLEGLLKAGTYAGQMAWIARVR